MNKRLIFIFFGPPGSGKGTQAEFLAKKINLPVISTGALLRQEIAGATVWGKQAKEQVASGRLVSDQLVEQIVGRRLSAPDTAKGFILDGYPRSAAQLRGLLTRLGENDEIWLVEIKVGDREVLNRLTGRRVCACGMSYHLVYKPPRVAGRCDDCGQKLALRDDDKPAVVKTRLAAYQQTAKPLLAYGERLGRLISINGEQPIPKVWSDLSKEITKKISKR